MHPLIFPETQKNWGTATCGVFLRVCPSWLSESNASPSRRSAWLTVDKRALKNNRSRYEHRVLVQLAELLPTDVKVCVVADRGFGDHDLYRILTEELCFDHTIRFRGNIAVTATTGETRTPDRYKVGTVVRVQEPDMKQAWCLAASGANATATAKELTGYDGRRWGIACRLRDTKDLRFGMGMGSMHVKTPMRRDRGMRANRGVHAIALHLPAPLAGEKKGTRHRARRHRPPGQPPPPGVLSP